MAGAGPTVVYSGSTISLPPGTYNGLRIRRTMCKLSGCGSGTAISTEAFCNINYVTGPLVNSASNTGDQTLPTCASSITRTLIFTSTTFTPGENYKATWNDIF